MVTVFELEFYKRWSEKVLVRLNESKWTQLFMLTSVLQAIIIITLELRVYSRNIDTEQSLSAVGNITDQMRPNASCIYQPSYVRLNNIKDENIIFIIFQIFQVWFCFSAMYNQNSMQVIAIIVINSLFALNGIVQWVEVKKWFLDFDRDCPGRLSLHTQFVKYDLPLIIALLLFSLALGFLCWKLYQQYGWNIYKKIGADLDMQNIYRTYLIHFLLLKLDAIFILGLSIEALNIYVYSIGKLSDLKHLRYMPEQFYLFHLSVTVLSAVNQILAYYSARKEFKSGIWYFFILFIIFGIVMAAVTLVWSIFVFGNFNMGLKDILNKPTEQTDDNLSDERLNKRFSIDDDE
ncbi:hypothetical protein F8M41_003739 [Gigaspora margarita]|uniref:Uncharacterized protein n=1 Tax=Gigaspora margarita TaxID=4874 RepID=A0A8H3XDB7_GIGMA|nr:hypothetical protein F8M41_003739 [Gigaspora margarita]